LLTNYKHTQPTVGLSVTFDLTSNIYILLIKENIHTYITK